MEGYINHKLEWAPMQDRYAQGMIRTIIDCMNRLQKDLSDKEARAMFMWTATYAWNGFYPCGLGAFDQIIHIVGHSFSAFYDVPHGSAMSVAIPAVMKYHLNERIEKFSGFAKEIFGIEGGVSKDTKTGLKKLAYLLHLRKQICQQMSLMLWLTTSLKLRVDGEQQVIPKT
jgi:alcohol dehydrogenase YqhD (iron-dependent ADH family)